MILLPKIHVSTPGIFCFTKLPIWGPPRALGSVWFAELDIAGPLPLVAATGHSASTSNCCLALVPTLATTSISKALESPPAEGTRLSDQMDQGMRIWNERGHLERTWQVIDAVRKVADGRGASMSQVAIAWVQGRPAVRSVILGARTLAQLDDNLAAGDLDLSEDETRLLDVASDPGAPDYPYGERGQTQRDRRISGGRF